MDALSIDASCAAIPPTEAGTLVGPDDDLARVLAEAPPNSTLLLASGTYSLDQTLEVAQEGLTIRSQSGDPTTVILDGFYAAPSIFSITAPYVTLAGMTLTRSYGPAVAVAPTSPIPGTHLYTLVIRDAGEEGVKIRASTDGLSFADEGILACSTLLRTNSGRQDASVACAGGVDAVSVAGWQVYGNTFSGFYCGEDRSWALAFRDGSRDTVIARNRIFDSDGLIALGDDEGPPATPRTDDVSACPEGGSEVEHYGGRIENNFLGLIGTDTENLARTGIFLARACQVEVYHNTLWSARGPDQSVRSFGAQTTAELTNNLVSSQFLEQPGLTLQANGIATPEDFVDAQSGDFHLVESSTALAAGSATYVLDDIDLEARGATPDLGADEH